MSRFRPQHLFRLTFYREDGHLDYQAEQRILAPTYAGAEQRARQIYPSLQLAEIQRLSLRKVVGSAPIAYFHPDSTGPRYFRGKEINDVSDK